MINKLSTPNQSYDKERNLFQELYETTLTIIAKTQIRMTELRIAQDLDKALISLNEKVKKNNSSLSFQRITSKWVRIMRTELSLCKLLEDIIKISLPDISAQLVHGLWSTNSPCKHSI